MPGDRLTVFAVSSSVVNIPTKDFARVRGSLVVSQTAFPLSGGLEQSGNEYVNAFTAGIEIAAAANIA